MSEYVDGQKMTEGKDKMKKAKHKYINDHDRINSSASEDSFAIKMSTKARQDAQFKDGEWNAQSYVRRKKQF